MSLPCDSPPISGSGPRANLLVLHPTPLNPSIPNYFRLLTQPRCGIAGRSAVFQLSDGLPAVQPFTDADRNASFGAVAGGRRTTSPDFIQQDHHNAQSQQWNFTVQKQLPNAVLIEAQYLANVAHNLGGVNVNINQIPLDANGQGPASQSRALTPYPQFNQVVLESPAWGNSTYHALNLKAEKRFARGLSYLVNYTWSKFLDDVEANNEAGGGQGAGYTHLSLRRLDKALSANDIRHRIVASGVWELPVKLNNKAANTILGGWSLGVIAEFRTGSPYGVIEQTNRSNTFSPGQRPHLVGAPELSSSRSTGDRIAEWFNTAAFEQPGAGVFGGSPRTLCCGPGQAVVDTSINKKFFFSESKHVEFPGGLLQHCEYAELRFARATPRQRRLRPHSRNGGDGSAIAARAAFAVLIRPSTFRQTRAPLRGHPFFCPLE